MSNKLTIKFEDGKKVEEIISKSMEKAFDNAVGNLESHTKQVERKLELSAGKIEKTAEEANKRQKWMMNAIYGLIFLTVVLTLLSALGGGLFEMIGIPKLYDVIGNKMEHTQGIMTLVWYIAYAFIPMVWVGGLGWLAYWIYNRFAR